MAYYVTGVDALSEIWFHGERHANVPFFIGDDRTVHRLAKETTAAGVREGDVLEVFDRRPYTGDFQFTEYLAHAKPGEILEVGVRGSNGVVKSAAITLGPRESPGFSLAGYCAYLIPVLGVPLLGLLVGYWVVVARPKDPNAWLVLLLLTLPEVAFGDIHADWWGGISYLVFDIWRTLVGVLAYPALLWFGFFFPERSRIDARWPAVKWIILASQVYALAISLWFGSLQAFDARRVAGWIGTSSWSEKILNGGESACVIFFLIAIFDKLRSATTPDARRRLRVLAVGSALSLGPMLIMFGLLPFFGYSFHSGSQFEIVVPFAVLFPLTLAYVLVVQRAMDLRVLLRIGTKYLVAKATLVIIQVAIAAFLILRFIVPMMERKQHPALTVILIAALVGLLFRAFVARDSLSNRLQRWLDRKFFREAYNAEVVLSEISDDARGFGEKNRLIETVSRRISEVLHVPQIAVWLRGGGAFALQQAVGFNVTGPISLLESSATVENLIRTNRPATVYRDRPEEWLSRASAEERRVLDDARVELLLPLPGRERLMGVMALGSKRSEEPYTPTDLRVLQSVATQTGLALEVDELAQSLAREAAQRARNDRELEIAHEVQERLFPQVIPKLPGVSLAGACRPAQGVGGDYYDMIELEDGRLGLAIGDVSGKGISAALLMASLRACLHTMTLVGSIHLPTLMQRMNRLVYEASAVNRYATFFFGIYDPSSRELDYVNAGHNPPIVIRGSSDASLPLEGGGPVIGLLPSAKYVEGSLTLEDGDLLLAYTDGISEAMTESDEEWGEERMVDAASMARENSAEHILRAIFNAADQFTGNAAQHDDMTLLVLKLSRSS
ncbi:MAG: SpoIIE family protein phosphatase [Acidobacteriaceae bacterium]|nr:SpoIIE family protein phosphatase [Acidobacteriaceae bacterium]